MGLQNLTPNDRGAADDRASQEVVLPPRAVVGAVEATFEEAYARFEEAPGDLTIDLSQCQFIEIASLQYITAHFRSRARTNFRTQLCLPAGDAGLRARHFLRRWAYAPALSLAAGRPFNQLVRASDLQYFRGSPTGGDSGDPYKGAVAKYVQASGPVSLPVEAYRFFGFVTWSIEDNVDKRRLVEREHQRWKHPTQVVLEVLNKRLRAPRPAQESKERSPVEKHDVVIGNIVFQAMTNAVRHPNARLIQSSSHMDEQGSGSQNFTIVFWDDGTAMHNTLRHVLDRGEPISVSTTFETDYLVVEDDPKGRRSYRRISSNQIPDRTASDADLLLSTIFPGTTCDPTLDGRISYAGEDPGHGLFILVKSAVEQFDGTVAFRTGDLFMNVSRLTDAKWQEAGLEGEKPHYRVKIRRTPEGFPTFLGNMITVRLPLDQGA